MNKSIERENFIAPGHSRLCRADEEEFEPSQSSARMPPTLGVAGRYSIRSGFEREL
jgi:hypothetical protein